LAERAQKQGRCEILGGLADRTDKRAERPVRLEVRQGRNPRQGTEGLTYQRAHR
jgi:hypothetical protein